MANNVTLLWTSSEGNTERTKSNITITVNQNFPTGPQAGGGGLFYGVDSNNGGRGPGAAATIFFPNQILIQGGFEQMFVQAFVDATNGVSGTIEANPPLPVDIRMSLYGGSGIFTLPAGTAQGQFNLEYQSNAPATMPTDVMATRQHVMAAAKQNA